MKLKNILLFAAAIVITIATGCTRTKTPEQIFDEQQSGVCLILNSYYYRITLPNGEIMYCTGIDEDGDLDGLTFEEEEAIKKRQMATGTGFFIDEKGTLMTNRHVVRPSVEEIIIKKAASSFMTQFRDLIRVIQQNYSNQFDELNVQKSNCISYDFFGNISYDYERINQIESQQRELASNYAQLEEVVETISRMDLSDIQVETINEVGLAYNDTHVTKLADFIDKNPCVVTKVSDDKNTDLALIQLKDKSTPEGKYIFKIKGRDDKQKGFASKIASIFSSDKGEELEMNQKLIMIGFNAGLILGRTNQGIQAQMTTGNVTQKPDGNQVLYSIPSLQGSSGSPVLDDKGYVCAVNFAKLRGADSFNFGIPQQRILNFLSK